MKPRCFVRRLLGVSIAFIALSFNAVAKPTALLFNDWVPGEKTEGVTKDFGDWKSPSGEFSIVKLKSGEDQDDFILVGRNLIDGKSNVLGYGTRSVGVTWFKTRMGNVAIIDYAHDPGQNDLYVLSATSQEKKIFWIPLYNTPCMGLAAGHCIEHYYWTLIKLDPDMGTLKLKAFWSYSDVPNGERKNMKTEGIYTVPLFYGYK